MPWLPFTESDVIARFSEKEREVYEDTAAAEYPEDGGDAVPPANYAERMPVVVAQILAEFRGQIRANPRVNFMGPAGTLPDFCIGPAAVLARTAMFALNPVPEGMTDPRRDEYNDAVRTRRDLSTLAASAFGEDDTPPANQPPAGSFGGCPYVPF